ncbi:MAG: gfo/Idh/MocA family oxidoreductase [Bacillota bacterium]|nr:MAG: gfo/Idh/MocA family oxidoreductase [Bacillota bacterium]
MGRVGLGVVGLGRWAMVVSALARQAATVDIVAAFDSNPGAARSAAQLFGLPPAPSLDALMDDPAVRGVLVITSNESHLPLARRAMEAGKDVFVEKPIAPTLTAAEQMVALAESTGRILMVGHNTRRTPAVREAKRIIESGLLGRVVSYDAAFSYFNLEEVSPDSWRADPARCPGGPLLQLGIHHADNLLYLGGPVSAVCGNLLYLPSPALQGGQAVGGRLQLAFTSGALGTISSDYCTSPETFTILIRGEEGEVTVLDHHRLLLRDRSRSRKELTPAGPDSVVAELEEFAACIVSRDRPETDGRVGLEALRVILAGLESAQGGRIVHTGPEVRGEPAAGGRPAGRDGSSRGGEAVPGRAG